MAKQNGKDEIQEKKVNSEKRKSENKTRHVKRNTKGIIITNQFQIDNLFSLKVKELGLSKIIIVIIIKYFQTEKVSVESSES